MKILISFVALAALTIPEPGNLPINKIQVIGSHNSYKQAIDPALYKVLAKRDSAGMSGIDYEHIPLTDQLTMGLLNLEIDVYADEKGGRYAHPKGLDMVKNQPPFDPDGKMNQPGFKVFHVVDIDFRSHCLTFVDCLTELRTWSEKHPDHNPIFITLEGKDQGLGAISTAPEKFTEKTFDELDNVLLTTLGKQHLITPDMVRGQYNTLEEAVLKGNWPTLTKAKGKFLFLLDDRSSKRAMYMAGHPSLKGRVLFANADPGTPEAAMMIRNNPNDSTIAGLVKKGYIIRTRADSGTKQARQNDRSDFVAACNSGAQIITTDYYLKSTHFRSEYSVSFDGNTYFRVNPLFGGRASAAGSAR